MTRESSFTVLAVSLCLGFSLPLTTIDAKMPSQGLEDHRIGRNVVAVGDTVSQPATPVLHQDSPQIPDISPEPTFDEMATPLKVRTPRKAGEDIVSLNSNHEDGCEVGETFTTDNQQFEITLLSHESSGGVSTFEWYVCGGPDFTHGLSHWIVDLTGINCFAEGFDMHDLVIGAEFDGEPVDYVVGTDPTTGVTGVKFDNLTESCGTFTLYLDETVLTEGLVVGCVNAATKAGNQDVREQGKRGANHGRPGFAIIAGPVCGERPPECDSETAFATGESAVCFSVYSFNRWGWTIGPLPEGAYDFELYAGAGQCDIDNGALVGKVEVNYDVNDEGVGSVVVKYIVDAPYELLETHLYVGCSPIPVATNGKETVAPGQYGNQDGVIENNETTYLVTDLECEDGQIYIIAHAVVEICE